MDPNLFHLDWDRLFEVVAAICVVAVILERALSVVFENGFFLASPLDKKGVKETIALAAAYWICRMWHFDAVSMILLSERTTTLGVVITAGTVAGGSKGSVKLFRDMMGIQSSAYRSKHEDPDASKGTSKKDSKKDPKTDSKENPKKDDEKGGGEK